MARGWKCSRCSTVNDESGVTCRGCGLIRGSAVLPTVSDAPPTPGSTPVRPGWAAPRAEHDLEPASAAADDPSADLPGWTAPGGEPADVPAAPIPIWRRIPIGGLLATIVIVGGAVSGWYFAAGRSDTGEIAKSGDLMATELRVGDCFDLKEPEADEIGDVTARPCTEEHEYELYFTGSLPEGAYPAEAVFEEFVAANCDSAFTAYVGKAYQDSDLDVYWMFPTDEGWRDGDRSIQCAVFHPRVNRLTASLRGSNR
jgi:hypothetical protein